ncbi:MAG: DUF3592 domain-containing protein [Oscillospiraceae bacterium]|nr:DUF3592 domain-containing protein [Oscillospiraceae bacterium]
MQGQNYTAYAASGNRKPVSRKGIFIAFFVIFFIILAVSFIPFLLTYFVFSTEMAQANPKGCTEPVYAVVIRNIQRETEDEDTGRQTEYVPVFQYKYNGNTYEAESAFADNSPRFKEGEEVKLMLDPADPEHFYDPGSRRILLGAYLLTLTFPAGVLFGAVVVGVMLRIILGKKGIAGQDGQ